MSDDIHAFTGTVSADVAYSFGVSSKAWANALRKLADEFEREPSLYLPQEATISDTTKHDDFTYRKLELVYVVKREVSRGTSLTQEEIDHIVDVFAGAERNRKQFEDEFPLTKDD